MNEQEPKEALCPYCGQPAMVHTAETCSLVAELEEYVQRIQGKESLRKMMEAESELSSAADVESHTKEKFEETGDMLLLEYCVVQAVRLVGFSEKENVQEQLKVVSGKAKEILFTALSEYARDKAHLQVELSEVRENLITNSYELIQRLRNEVEGRDWTEQEIGIIKKFEALDSRMRTLKVFLDSRSEAMKKIGIINYSEIHDKSTAEQIKTLKHDVDTFLFLTRDI